MVMKYLLDNDLLHGDCLTVTGKTIAENLRHLPGLKAGQNITKQRMRSDNRAMFGFVDQTRRIRNATGMPRRNGVFQYVNRWT